jgi:hypothetical protein
MGMNTLLLQMITARAGGANPALAEILGRFNSGDPSAQDPQELFAQLGSGNPLLSALGKHFVAGQNNGSAQVIDVESEADRGQATGHDDESQEENSSEVANELREDLRKLSAELKVLRDRNDLLAAALGACCLCWGQDPDCRFCRGRGRPGFAAPDEAHIGEFVLPAIHMLRVQRAKNNRSSPPANSVAKGTGA